MESRPEAGQVGGGSRRVLDRGRAAAETSAVVARGRPSPCDLGQSSAALAPSSRNEVGGRLGTMARAGMERWRDRLALVTGASGGIGAAVARALVQQGLKVVGCARTVGNIEVRSGRGAGRSGSRRFRWGRVQVGEGEWPESRCDASFTCLPPQCHLQRAQGQEMWMPNRGGLHLRYFKSSRSLFSLQPCSRVQLTPKKIGFFFFSPTQDSSEIAALQNVFCSR